MLHYVAFVSALFLVAIRNVGAPETMDIAVSIHGYRFAVEANANLRRVVNVEIPHNNAFVCDETYKANVVLSCHRMRLFAYLHLDGMLRIVAHHWYVFLLVAIHSVWLEQRHLLTTAMWYYSACDSSNHEVAA